jgi:hypothetical protein
MGLFTLALLFCPFSFLGTGLIVLFLSENSKIFSSLWEKYPTIIMALILISSLGGTYLMVNIYIKLGWI